MTPAQEKKAIKAWDRILKKRPSISAGDLFHAVQKSTGLESWELAEALQNQADSLKTKKKKGK